MNTLSDQDLLRRHVVDKLTPEIAQQDQVFALNDSTAAPFVEEIGPDGLVRERPLMTLAKSAKFVDKGGNICDVALRTGRVLSNDPQAAWYETYTLVDQIRGGAIPLANCPHSLDYQHVKRGPLVPPPEGVQACEGAPNGCVHMQAIIKARRAESHKRWEVDNKQMSQMNGDQVKSMFEGMTTAIAEQFGTSFGEKLDAAMGRAAREAAKTGLKGPGEEDEPAPTKKGGR